MSRRLLLWPFWLCVLAAQGCSDAASRDSSATEEDYGIPVVAWPTGFDDMDAIMERLPRNIGDLTVQPKGNRIVEREFFDMLQLRFVGDSPALWLFIQNLRTPDVQPRLAMPAMFGSLIDQDESGPCASDTYRGTIEMSLDGGYPGTSEEQVPTTGLAWYSCHLQAREGTDQAGGYIAGWYKGSVLWTVKGPSQEAVQEVVDALAAAYAPNA